MATEFNTSQTTIAERFSANTEIASIRRRLLDAPSDGVAAWLRTTAGLVAFSFGLQFVTGLLLAFHYVPSTDNAYSTVSFIEQVIGAGSWIRSLHYHSSVVLPVLLLAHLGQLIFRNAFAENRSSWTFTLLFLALVLGAGTTGYALVWDARSINGVNVAASLAGNAPILGSYLRAWLLNGDDVSTLTLSRFYGLHVFATPALILMCAVARIFVFGGRKGHNADRHDRGWFRAQMLRNSIAIGIFFLAIGLFSITFPAPLAPSAATAPASFLPRPGPQFLWLFELQKYTDGVVAAIVALGLPAFFLGLLMILPSIKAFAEKRKMLVSTTFAAAILVVGGLTALAFWQDARDPRIAEQLAKQEKEEAEFRKQTFKPRLMQPATSEHRPSDETAAVETASLPPSAPAPVAGILMPPSYKQSCSKCHGANGEGKGASPPLDDLTTRDEERRTEEDLVAIINDPSAFGLSSKMPSYAKKLTDEEKIAIARWIATLKPKP